MATSTTNKRVKASEARAQFASIMEHAKSGPVTLTHYDKPIAVVLSYTEYEALARAADDYWIKRADAARKRGFADPKALIALLEERLGNAG